MKMEIRPADGGEDAAQFADELARAVAKHSGTDMKVAGTSRTLHRL